MNGRSQLMADVMAALMLPAVGAAYQAEYRDTMSWQVTMTSLWLDVYRQEHGTYPDSLDQLVPDVLVRRSHGFVCRPADQVPASRQTDMWCTASAPTKPTTAARNWTSGPSGLVGDLAVRIEAADNRPVIRQLTESSDGQIDEVRSYDPAYRSTCLTTRVRTAGDGRYPGTAFPGRRPAGRSP